MEMMKNNTFPTELLYQVFSLLLVFILVHGAYLSIIRPKAEAFLAAEQELILNNPDYIQQRNFYVVIKDFEQEACFVLMFWAFAILGYKGYGSFRERTTLE